MRRLVSRFARNSRAGPAGAAGAGPAGAARARASRCAGQRLLTALTGGLFARALSPRKLRELRSSCAQVASLELALRIAIRQLCCLPRLRHSHLRSRGFVSWYRIRGLKHKRPAVGEPFMFEKWMGWQDSNLRMTESKSVVLPLDDTPSSDCVRTIFRETSLRDQAQNHIFTAKTA